MTSTSFGSCTNSTNLFGCTSPNKFYTYYASTNGYSSLALNFGSSGTSADVYLCNYSSTSESCFYMQTIYLNSTSTGTYEYLKVTSGMFSSYTTYTVVNSSVAPFFYAINTYSSNNSAITLNSNLQSVLTCKWDSSITNTNVFYCGSSPKTDMTFYTYTCT